ncbi:hypothetical protein SAMN02745753_01097 [Marinomonas polaris DSM 16579]|uniref:Uncharacterized protein n=1 Tax=Marinomonas polaris DSM 16579 TaxID=1122206 RepID=A0A1M4Y1N5_9GAMM|nr:hypothetical protein SAMN02745753_01097 [Marinomonas polaris DSM 16579]
MFCMNTIIFFPHKEKNNPIWTNTLCTSANLVHNQAFTLFTQPEKEAFL